MTCRCTCGGCDCPKLNVIMYPVAGVAAAAPVNIVDWGWNAVAAANPAIVVKFDNAACAAGAAPCLPFSYEVAH